MKKNDFESCGVEAMSQQELQKTQGGVVGEAAYAAMFLLVCIGIWFLLEHKK